MKTEMNREAEPAGTGMKWANRLAWAPIPLFLVAIGILYWLNIQKTAENRELLTILNVLFNSVVGFLVAILAALTYLSDGAPALLFLGCSNLALGIVTALVGFVGHDANVQVTMHNSGVCLAGLSCLASAIAALTRSTGNKERSGVMTTAYLCVIMGVLVISWFAVHNLFPPFVIPGHGPTMIRAVILGAGIVQFALAGALFHLLYLRSRSAFPQWYSIGLILYSIGLVGVWLTVPGTPLNWTGRSAQFLAGPYILVAVLAASRQAGAWRITLEQALRRERDFSAAVLDTSGALVVVLDQEGHITRFNRACEQVTGYYPSEVLGRVFWDFLIPPEDLPGVKATWAAIRAGDFPNTHENFWLAKDGSRRLISWSNTAMVGPGGKPEYIIATGLDITERKRAEEALRRKQAEIQTLFDNAPAGLVLFDAFPPYTVLVHNRYYQELFAEPFRSQGMVGLNVYDYAPEVDAAGVVAVFDEVVRTQQAKSLLDFPYRSNPPKESWFNWHMAPIILDGRVVALVSMSIEVTDRHIAEEALRESEERLRFALETSHTGAWDLDLVDHTANRSLEHDRIFGYGQQLPQWTYEMFLDHVLPDDRAAIDAKFQEAIAAHSDWSFECRIRRADGEVRWIWAAGRHREDSTGSPRRMAGIVQDITERKQAEVALRASEERFRSVVENMSEGLMLFDAQGMIYQNPASLRIHGLKASEEMRIEHKELPIAWTGWDETGRPLPFEEWPVSRVLRHERFQDQVLRAVRVETGHEFYGSYNGFPILGADGKLTLGFITIRDITERKRAEEERQRLLAAVQHERDRLSALVNSITDEIWFADAEKKVTLVNPAVWKQFDSHIGDAKEVEKIAASFEVYRPDGTPRPVDEAPPLRALRGETVTNQEEIVRTPATGRLRHRQVNAAPVRDPDGGIIGSVSVVRDITARKQVEEELRQERDKAKQLLDIVGVMILALDTEGRVTLTNARGSQILGRKVEEIIGKDWADTFLPERIRTELKAAFAQLISGNLALVEYIENPVLASDGTERMIAWHSSIIRDHTGQIIGTLSSGEDVTDRRRAEEERERLIVELETAIKELEGFTYSVSHDLRAPIRHMNSYAQLLKRDAWAALGEKSRLFLDTVLNASRKMGILVDELLEFSRMGRTELKESMVELDTLIREVIQSVSEETKGRDIQWRIDPMPRVWGDASMLHLAFLNLIGNALKFTRSRSPASIEIGHKEEGTEQVIFVRDNGVGFDMRHCDKLFGVFQRLHTMEEFEGTGIGLANVQRIVHRHGGRVWAEGKVGQGATFSVALPKGRSNG